MRLHYSSHLSNRLLHTPKKRLKSVQFCGTTTTRVLRGSISLLVCYLPIVNCHLLFLTSTLPLSPKLVFFFNPLFYPCILRTNVLLIKRLTVNWFYWGAPMTGSTLPALSTNHSSIVHAFMYFAKHTKYAHTKYAHTKYADEQICKHLLKHAFLPCRIRSLHAGYRIRSSSFRDYLLLKNTKHWTYSYTRLNQLLPDLLTSAHKAHVLCMPVIELVKNPLPSGGRAGWGVTRSHTFARPSTSASPWTSW